MLPSKPCGTIQRPSTHSCLHSHITGAIYAESYLRWAHEDGLCVDSSTFALVPHARCDVGRNVPVPTNANDPLYDDIVRAWSMQDFSPADGSGHDHFFSTFGKFGLAASGRFGDMVAEVVARAAAQNEQYVELMHNLTSGKAATIAGRVWTGGTAPTPADFADLRARLLADPGWPAIVTGAKAMIDEADAKVKSLLRCGTSDADPGCDVTVRYLFQTSRNKAPHEVFAQFVAAFEVAKTEGRVVGMNLVSVEDAPVALRDYDLQMQMVGFLHAAYADGDGRSPLRISLHAGELTAHVLPQEEQQHLTFHIRRAVEVGRAERIGHGVDVLDEDDSAGLRRELREKGVLVETCLTSNDVILGVSGSTHPLATYLADGVPIALATDDEGVSRSDITREFERAVVDQGLRYKDLKKMARASLDHAFVPGASYWGSLEAAEPVNDCVQRGAACDAFVATSERARLERALELAFEAFEASIP